MACARGGPQFQHRLAHVALHRLRRDVQVRADLLPGQAPGHEAEHLPLARAQSLVPSTVKRAPGSVARRTEDREVQPGQEVCPGAEVDLQAPSIRQLEGELPLLAAGLQEALPLGLQTRARLGRGQVVDR